MQTNRWVVAALIFALAGCASGVKQVQSENKQYLSTRPAKHISIGFTEEAKAKVADNLDFNDEKLLDYVRRALTAKDMLDERQPQNAPGQTIEILVKDFRVRSTFSAVMFGFMAGNDSLTGDVILKDAAGKEINRFEVNASYALGGLAGGQGDTRLGWLYQKFAELTVENLAGGAQ